MRPDMVVGLRIAEAASIAARVAGRLGCHDTSVQSCHVATPGTTPRQVKTRTVLVRISGWRARPIYASPGAIDYVRAGTAVSAMTLLRNGWRSPYVSDRHNHSNGPKWKCRSQMGDTMSWKIQMPATTAA